MPDPKNWVDFKHVRETVDFAEVLQSYGVQLRLRGDQHHGFCPLPDHNGQRRSPSFSAHMGKKAFHCFGCQAQGNAIDFVAIMEGLNPGDSRDIRQAALLMQERFLHEVATPPARPQRTRPQLADERTHDSPRPSPKNARRAWRQSHRRRPAHARTEPKPDQDQAETPEQPKVAQTPSENQQRVINAPLTFELKNLDPTHPYLQSRGLTPETIKEFGLGYCERGIMAGRIAIPLRDQEGNLIGYAGRIVDDAAIDAKNPKYLLPGTRERDGTIFEFSKSAFLFNGHRIESPATDLIVVEGFFSVFHMHQCGWENVVALMGSSISEEQAQLILRKTHFDAQLWIMTDGDDAGIRCAHEIFERLAPGLFVRWVTLEPGEQPHNCSPERLHELLDMPAR